MSDLPELPQSTEFKEAAAAVRDFATLPEIDDALKFYGLYKFGCHGKNTEAAPWVLQGKSGRKWTAWDEVSNSGITPDEAQKQYVELYKKLKSKYA